MIVLLLICAIVAKIQTIRKSIFYCNILRNFTLKFRKLFLNFSGHKIMIIIIKKISTKVKIPDINDFIIPAVKGNFLEKSGRIKRILMLSQKSFQTGFRQHHFLVEVDSYSVGKRIIKQLNRKTLAGKLVELSEYKNRNWHNDRRVNYSGVMHVNNRRINDRRQQYQEITSKPIQINGAKIAGKGLLYLPAV
jgi:hypothetical protein